jgi:hypothetical protein
MSFRWFHPRSFESIHHYKARDVTLTELLELAGSENRKIKIPESSKKEPT